MSDRVELDESLVGGILTPLMEYADLLNEASDYGKSRMLCVLIDDAQSQLENVFSQISKMNPYIRVSKPFRV